MKGVHCVDDVTLGERIRIARTMRGLSQEELAERIGKDQKAISKYELGQRRMFATEIPKLAAALDVPIIFFFEDAATDSDLDHEILKQIHKLPNHAAQNGALDLLIAYVKAISEQARG